MTVQPGDVLVIADSKWASWWIRLQARLLGKPCTWNHIAIMSHIDAGGTAWVIEGKPSGVGWVLAAKYIDHPATIHNADQPKTAEQRAAIVQGARTLIGTHYDWLAIAELGGEILRINALWRRWREWGEDTPPIAVICSSLADHLYERAGLANPGGLAETRFTDVGDWAQWIEARGWQ